MTNSYKKRFEEHGIIKKKSKYKFRKLLLPCHKLNQINELVQLSVNYKWTANMNKCKYCYNKTFESEQYPEKTLKLNNTVK